MLRPDTLYRLILADVRERTRGQAFFVTMLGVSFFGYLVLTGGYTVQFGEFRTVYDATWAGSLMAVCSSIMLTLAGFYLVKGSITRDHRTEVGQIIAASPIGSLAYLASKFASNLLVLWLMTAALGALAFVMLLFRNETHTLNLWAFVSPFLIITSPVTVFVAAVAVLFDTSRWLRGSLGNVIYLFVAEMCIVLGMLTLPVLDLAGATTFTDSVRAAAETAFPGERIAMIMGFVMFDPAAKVEATRTFPWSGIEWTGSDLLVRLGWIGLAGLATAITIPLFDRFDSARTKHKSARHRAKRPQKSTAASSPNIVGRSSRRVIAFPFQRFAFMRVLAAELRLALKGKHWFWYIVAAGLAAAQVAAPYTIARMYLTPVAMVWPLVIWSSLGTREQRYNTSAMVLSVPNPIARQFSALWLSGVMVAFAAVSCMILRAVVAGQLAYAMMLVTAAFLVPTIGLLFGTLSGSGKLFEVVYLMVWYIGSIDQVAVLDILGTTASAITPIKLVMLLLVFALALVATFSARRAQIARG